MVTLTLYWHERQNKNTNLRPKGLQMGAGNEATGRYGVTTDNIVTIYRSPKLWIKYLLLNYVNKKLLIVSFFTANSIMNTLCTREFTLRQCNGVLNGRTKWSFTQLSKVSKEKTSRNAYLHFFCKKYLNNVSDNIKNNNEARKYKC